MNRQVNKKEHMPRKSQLEANGEIVAGRSCGYLMPGEGHMSDRSKASQGQLSFGDSAEFI
jgi:hypothetical protein